MPDGGVEVASDLACRTLTTDCATLRYRASRVDLRAAWEHRPAERMLGDPCPGACDRIGGGVWAAEFASE